MQAVDKDNDLTIVTLIPHYTVTSEIEIKEVGNLIMNYV